MARRQLFGRVGGGIAGLTLAAFGLDFGRSPAAAAGTISVRDLVGHIPPHCHDPSQGIRAALPNDHQVISLRALASRYAGIPVNYCQPLQLSVSNVTNANGGFAHVTGANYTPSGMVKIGVQFATTTPDTLSTRPRLKLGLMAPSTCSWRCTAQHPRNPSSSRRPTWAAGGACWDV